MIRMIQPHVRVIRNDDMTVDELQTWPIDRIIISPGPGRPATSGIILDVIQSFYTTVPILGVCLGHQAIGEAFGGIVTYANQIIHGKSSPINHDGQGIYDTIPNPMTATRYHSLVIDPDTLPNDSLTVTARLEDGTIMGIQHRQYPTIGIQYHPESILTEYGDVLIKNFIHTPAPTAIAL